MLESNSTLNPSTPLTLAPLILFFWFFVWLKKIKIKNKSITGRHVSVRPAKQWKTRRLIWRFLHLFFFSYGGTHHLALH